MYSFIGQQNNALAALRKGLELAKSSESNELLGLLHQNIHLNYFRRGEYENAEKHLRLSFELNEDAMEMSRYYLNFARLFKNTNQTDSLNLYVDKLRQAVEQSDNLLFNVAVYRFLAVEAKARYDFNAAFEYLQKDLVVLEKITRRRLEQSVYEARQRFNYLRHQEAHTQALLRIQKWTILLLLFSLIVSLFAALIYRRMSHQRNSLLSQQVVISTLQQTNDDIVNKQIAIENRSQVLADRLKEALEWKLRALHKSTFLKLHFKNTDNADVEKAIAKSKEVIFGENHSSTWVTFMETIDQMYPNLSLFITTDALNS